MDELPGDPTMRKPLVAGNWKLNGDKLRSAALVEAIAAADRGGVEVMLFPPLVYLSESIARASGRVGFGAQDVDLNLEGAFTGETSASMLVDVGAISCLVGHSERRQYHSETSRLVAEKARVAASVGLRPIVCVGETLQEREAGRTEWALQQQIAPLLEDLSGLDRMVLAYEPVWAIGTGKTATAAQAQEVHAWLRSEFRAIDAKMADSLVILYGGSVKPSNAADIFAQPDIDGGLIGGASLVAEDFLAIVAAAKPL